MPGCIRQVCATVSRRPMAISPRRLRLPKLIVPHWTAVRKACSAALLVGSTPASSKKVNKRAKVLPQGIGQIGHLTVAAIPIGHRQRPELAFDPLGSIDQLCSVDEPGADFH